VKNKQDIVSLSLVDKAYDILRNEIIEGRLSSGYPVLEQEIATRLDMSRTPIRAAIDRLKNEGLVETIKRKGVFVKPLTVMDVEHAYEATEGLEGMLVKVAVLRASKTELDELLAMVHRLVAAEKTEEWPTLDRQFHRRLIELARNPVIEASLARVATIVDRVRFMGIHTRVHQPGISSGEHLATVEAMVNGDGDSARRLHQQHWHRVRESIVTYMTTNMAGGASMR
jgi:DNA-binding GntR family transcriptional regulator